MKDSPFIQKDTYKACLQYLKKLKKKKIDYNYSGYAYFCTWSKTLGYYKAKSLLKGYSIELLKEIFKNIIKIGYLSNFELDGDVEKDKNVIFIAWSDNKNLNKSIFQSERYISGFRNERKKGLWFLIHQNNYNKKNKFKNILLLKRNKIIFNFFFLIKNILKILIRSKFNILKFSHELNTENIFSRIIIEKFRLLLKKKKIKKIILSYEAQPFQKALISYVKKKYPRIKIYCDIHSLQAAYLHLIDLKYDANFYITHHNDQRKFLIKNLKMKKKKILYKKIALSKKKKDFLGKIFLPYSLDNIKEINKQLVFLEDKKIINLKNFNLQPHPVALSDKQYKKNYNEILQNFKFGKPLSNTVVIIGNTNVLFEAIALDLDVLHVVTNEICDPIHKFFWKNINGTKLYDKIYKLNR